jgi:hypothetical protein
MSATYGFPVKVREHRPIGSVHVRINGLGDTLWEPVRLFASQKLGVFPESIIISSVDTVGGENMDMGSASNMPLARLKQLHAEVVLETPEGSIPVWEQREAKMQQDIDVMKQDFSKLMRSHNQLQSRVNAIALRSLLDSARTKINNGVELTPATKITWNENIDAMELQRMEELNLTMPQLKLTKYGPRTLQQLGAVAAHVVCVQEVARAVTEYSDHHRALFRFVYGNDPEDYVFDVDA